jgi:hypothetical protein
MGYSGAARAALDPDHVAAARDLIQPAVQVTAGPVFGEEAIEILEQPIAVTHNATVGRDASVGKRRHLETLGWLLGQVSLKSPLHAGDLYRPGRNRAFPENKSPISQRSARHTCVSVLSVTFWFTFSSRVYVA